MIGRVANSFAKPADRRDLEQDIHLAIFRSISKFDGRSSEKTYIYRIAQNCGINY